MLMEFGGTKTLRTGTCGRNMGIGVCCPSPGPDSVSGSMLIDVPTMW